MARTTMDEIREDLRGITEAGNNDWTTGVTTYFSDYVLDNILDKYASKFVYSGLKLDDPHKLSDGTFSYTVYSLGFGNVEQSTGGTAVFYLQDNTGGTVAAADYSVDYRNGIVTFTADTDGAAYFATGTYYDINAAAAEIWRLKAVHASNSFDFSTDNHSVKRSQVYQQYMEMANYYRGLSSASSGGRGIMVREDTDAN